MCAAAMLTEGNALLLSHPAPHEAVRALEDHLKAEALPQGVNGPDEASALFASLRAARGLAPQWAPSTRLVLYELSGREALVAPALEAGERLRTLEASHVTRVSL